MFRSFRAAQRTWAQALRAPAATPLAVPALLATLLAAPLARADIELTDLPGVAVTANSCYLAACEVPGAFAAANAIDNLSYLPGSGGHAWNAGAHGSLASPNWLRVDFGAVYALGSVELRFTDNGGAWQGYSNDYELRASTDGTTWQLLGSGTLVDLTGNAAALGDSYAFAAGSQPLARWLEYRVVGGTHWSALDEINATGTLAAVPEPGTWALWAAGLACMVGLRARRG